MHDFRLVPSGWVAIRCPSMADKSTLLVSFLESSDVLTQALLESSARLSIVSFFAASITTRNLVDDAIFRCVSCPGRLDHLTDLRLRRGGDPKVATKVCLQLLC